MKNQNSQLAIVTGGGSGIGLACAKRLSLDGWTPLLVGRKQNKLEAAQKLIGGKTRFLALDLARPATEIKKALKDFLGAANLDQHLGLLINCAGTYQRRAFEDTPDAVWDEMLQTNLMSAVRMAQAVWPYFKRRKYGNIINISSTLGLRPVGLTAAYSAAKAAVNNFTESLALEGAEFGIRVNAICPGIVDTPIHDFNSLGEEANQLKAALGALHPLQRIGTPEDVASVASLFWQPECQWVTGSILKVDGGLHLTSKDS